MTCNLWKFIRQQEFECYRISRTCDEGSQNRSEWEKTAQALLERREEHVKVCKKCKQPPS
jgi:hypothetical protein